MSGMLTPEVLVLDAAGSAGSGVVGALLEAGSPVVAAGPDSPRMRQLFEHFADEPALMRIRTGGMGSDRAAASLAARLARRRRPLRAVFASLATPLEAGRLMDRPAGFLKQKLETDLLPHLAMARHLVPLLARHDGTAHYILIDGPMARCGWAGYGHASITAAALRMLANVLHVEAQAMGVRVQLLSVDQPLRTADNERNACEGWPDALAVGRHAVSLLSDQSRARAVVPFDPARALLPPRPLWLGAGKPFASALPQD